MSGRRHTGNRAYHPKRRAKDIGRLRAAMADTHHAMTTDEMARVLMRHIYGPGAGRRAGRDSSAPAGPLNDSRKGQDK